jgi:acyl-CoA hydrolase
MVAVDEQRQPKEVPALNLDTDWKRCRFEAAEQRKKCVYKKCTTFMQYFQKTTI